MIEGEASSLALYHSLPHHRNPGLRLISATILPIKMLDF